jgi:adenine-specific DNA glycosylase
VRGLGNWYEQHGRHDLPWRTSRDRWQVLVSEVMLHQTQVARVAQAWPAFIGRFPTPTAMAEAGPGAVITAWARLGYPRRARRLWEAAVVITEQGWPVDLETLPGIGRYTARAVASQVDDADVAAVEVNVRRVVERTAGARPTSEAEHEMRRVGRPLAGRDRLLALMDIGAVVCRVRDPRCTECPLRSRCHTRGALVDARPPRRTPRYAGSFRQRRGQVLAALRDHETVTADSLDDEALASLVADSLAVVADGTARLP